MKVIGTILKNGFFLGRGPMKIISLKLQLAAGLSLFLALVSFQEHNAAIFLYATLAVGCAVLIDGVAGFVRDRKWRLSESALITGLLIGFVLSADNVWWTYPAAAALSILSKQLIRIKGKHIFNPAAFGVLAVLCLLGSTTRWYGAYLWYLVIPLGTYFVFRIHRLPMVAAYYVTAVVLYGGQAFLQKVSFLDALVYLNHFFVFIMLIEPKTSPFDKVGMVVLGVLASALCFGSGFLNLSFSGELAVLLIVNVIYFVSQKLKGGKV